MSDTMMKVIFVIGFTLILALIITMIVVAVINEKNVSLITSGTVIDKHYYPPRISQTQYSVTYSPAQYTVTIKGDNGITGVYDVTPEKYKEVKINDWYYNVKEELK